MLSAIEVTIPAPQAAWVGDFSIPACRSALRWPIVPVFTSASTITNNPATNGNTLQEMPFTTGQGDWRLRASTAAAVTSPQMKVGNPNCTSSAEAVSSTTPIAAIPNAVSLPPRPSLGCGTRLSMLSSASAWR